MDNFLLGFLLSHYATISCAYPVKKHKEVEHGFNMVEEENSKISGFGYDDNQYITCIYNEVRYK